MEEVKEEDRLRNEVNMKCNERGRQEGKKKCRHNFAFLFKKVARWRKKKKKWENSERFFFAHQLSRQVLRTIQLGTSHRRSSHALMHFGSHRCIVPGCIIC